MTELMAPHPDGATIRLRVVPRAGRTEFAGQHGDAVKLRVAAPPVEGAANEEACRFLAKTIGVRAADVSILSGIRGRDKVLLVRGISAAVLHEALGGST